MRSSVCVCLSFYSSGFDECAGLEWPRALESTFFLRALRVCWWCSAVFRKPYEFGLRFSWRMFFSCVCIIFSRDLPINPTHRVQFPAAYTTHISPWIEAKNYFASNVRLRYKIASPPRVNRIATKANTKMVKDRLVELQRVKTIICTGCGISNRLIASNCLCTVDMRHCARQQWHRIQSADAQHWTPTDRWRNRRCSRRGNILYCYTER